MNSRQSWVVRLTIAALLLVIAFPPYEFVQDGLRDNLGYHFVLKPPKAFVGSDFTASVNVSLLIVQLLGLSAIAGLLFLLFYGTNRPSQATEDKPVAEGQPPSAAPSTKQPLKMKSSLFRVAPEIHQSYERAVATLFGPPPENAVSKATESCRASATNKRDSTVEHFTAGKAGSVPKKDN